uniref:hypothetical protein n=1 Tax=Neorhizobium sp. EC2-8 TaxID=3129230 RepID=UPI003101B037
MGFDPHAVNAISIIFMNRNIEQLRKHLVKLSAADLPPDLRQELKAARRCFYETRRDVKNLVRVIRAQKDEPAELEEQPTSNSGDPAKETATFSRSLD